LGIGGRENPRKKGATWEKGGFLEDGGRKKGTTQYSCGGKEALIGWKLFKAARRRKEKKIARASRKEK